MHSGNNDQNNQPDPEDWAMRAIRAQRLAQSNQTIWSELSRFITENQLSVHLVVLFITFVLIQSAHYRNSNRMKNEIITFLVENEVLVRGVDDYKVDHFMDHYDCYSLVSCVDRLVRVGAPSRGHHPEHAPAAAAVILTTTDEDDQRFEHVSGEPSSSWWNGFEQDDQYEEDASEKHKKIDLTSLVDAAVRRKELFILDKWLHSRSIPVSFRTRLRQHFAINSLSGLIGLLASTTAHQPNLFKANFLDSLDPLEVELFHNLRTHLFIPDTSNHHQLDQFVRRLRVDQWTACLEEDRAHFWTLGTFLLSTLVPVCIIEAIRMISNFSFAYKEGKCGFLTFITGSYLAPQNCKVIFDWKGPTTVSNMITFTIKFYQRNYKPYPITPEDQLSVHITNGSQVVPCSVEFGDLNPNLANVARVSFSGKAAGHYTINIFIGNSFTHIRGSPFKDIYFRPLSPSPFETAFVNHCSTVVCTVQSFHALIVEMRDRFGNLCLLDEDVDEVLGASENFEVIITEIVSDKKIDVCYYWQKQPGDNSRIALLLLFQSSGIYHVLVSYKGSLLKNGDFNIVCLSLSESETVKKSTTSSNKSCYFSAKLLPSTSHPFGSSSITKPKSVLCYISPKQLTIKEYILKIIPKRITTFRLSPSTKFYFVRNYNSFTKGSTSDIFGSVSSSLDNDISKSSSNSSGSFERSPNDDQFIIIDDGSQCPIELLTPERNIIVAVFTHFLLNKIGGSETFHDKQDFFNSEVRRFHQKTNHVNSGRVHLKIDRENLLESSIKATRSFSISDWCKRFEIEFVGENGIDWGGVRREWYELLCKSLFEPQYGDDIDSALYMRFKNDKQGLIHPNTNSNARLFYYEFAGRVVGKSMLDTSMGSSCKCLVNARFSRSFLAQLIGLRVNYRYFEKDDPDLYVSKIKFILENDVSALDLFFTEEEYDRKTGKLIRTFDLIPNGSHIRVTEDNKARYLDSLAQYRLSTCVKDQVEAFLKGLNDLIPDNLLSIFDENELELLLCGAATYSVSDLKLNHIVTGPTYDFQKVVDWFWRSVNNFSDEEFARLLQFTTGCSHLPPGGFADLNPRFQISSALTYGTLPTAHTCFNQICLPDYDTFDDFDRSIRIAITEGSEGFGLV